MKKQRAKKHHKLPDIFNHIFVLALSILLILLIWSQRESLASFSRLGYVGIFLVNFVSSATVLFPLPGVASVFAGGGVWNPFLVGIFSGVGASLGELLGYLVGYGGSGLVKSWEKKKWVKIVKSFFAKNGFLTVFLFSAIPSPVFDIIGIIAGAVNYSIWKFALATLTARVARNILLAWIGAKLIL